MNKKEVAVSAIAALFLQQYASAAAINLAENKIVEIKKKAYGANWIDISDRVQYYLYYSTLIRQGKIKASEVNLPGVTDFEVKTYENFPWYKNALWFKPYELAAGLLYLAAGGAAYYYGKDRVKNIGLGVMAAGALDLVTGITQKTPKKFISMYEKTEKLNPDKTYYGFVYPLEK
jgi:hypothetical protein